MADAAARWVEAAVAIKTRPAGGPRSSASSTTFDAAVAEETATGPIATLRLLLLEVQAFRDIASAGVPRAAAPPRVLHGPGGASFIGVDVIPLRQFHDAITFRGHAATVRCVDPGGIAAFARSWSEEARDRPRGGGVAAVLGAGNVTGLAAADVISQIFEHGRAALLKLHPVHAALEPVLRDALAPLVAAGLLAIVSGGADVARAAVAAPAVTHVHLTGGQAAFDAVVWGGVTPRPPQPVLAKPLTCELGGVTPWIIVPGRYTTAELRFQADTVAASIVNNTSFNCIATKCVVTCRSWEQREEFLSLVARRLEQQPARPAWYPGASAAWEAVTGRTAPADGTLPWVFRPGVDPTREPHWLDREWFVPVAVETAVEGGDIEAFCTRVAAFTRGLPGTLAASVTLPGGLSDRDRRRAELLVEHLEYGVVAVNTWSALAYAFGSVPWGGYPGGTLTEPGSGIGRVHDPLLLPLVHNSIVRAPLSQPLLPPWFPWHSRGSRLATGALAMHVSVARGKSGLWQLLRLLPAVLAG